MRSGAERFSGTLTNWNDERGFGFVSLFGSRRRVFVHISAFPHGSARPLVGDALAFEIETSDGKDRAVAVSSSRPVQFVARGDRRTKAAPALPSYLALVAFVALFIGIWSEWGVPVWAVAVYASVSAVTFIAYAVDKSAAKRGAHRISENSLHILAFVGGWPGAIVAQQLLRHKTAKRSFRAVFWVTVVLNTLAFIAIVSPALAELGAVVTR